MKPEEIPCIVLIFKCAARRWMNKTVPHLQSHQPGEFNFLICLDGCWIQQHFPFLFIIPRVYCAHADRSWLAVFYSFYWFSSPFSYFCIFKMVHQHFESVPYWVAHGDVLYSTSGFIFIFYYYWNCNQSVWGVLSWLIQNMWRFYRKKGKS